MVGETPRVVDAPAAPASYSPVPTVTTEPTVEKLIELLVASGHHELADAVRSRRASSLSEEERAIVTTYAKRVREASYTGTGLDPVLVRNAMALVTASGWGNEPEVTLPGTIQPLMQLD